MVFWALMLEINVRTQIQSSKKEEEVVMSRDQEQTMGKALVAFVSIGDEEMLPL